MEFSEPTPFALRATLHCFLLKTLFAKLRRSVPKFFARKPRTLGKCSKLCPGNLRMHAPPQAAVCPRNNVLAPDSLCVGQNAICNELGVFNHIGCVAHDTRDENLPVWQLDLPPDLILVLMADFAGFD